MKILKIAVYLAVIIILVYMSVFFKSYYLLISAFAVTFIAFIDILLFALPLGNVIIELNSDKTNYVKGDKGEVYIKLKSTRLFPIYKVKFTVKFKNKFYSEENIVIEVPLSMFKSKVISIPFDISKSGVISISTGDIETSDMFGIFKRVFKSPVSYSVVVMPKKVNIDNTYFGAADSEEIPAVNVYLSNNGDVSSYKEYTAGDRNNYINWKLFARTDKLYVREFERTSADDAVVLMDMNIENLDKAIDIVYSIGCKNGSFTLLWLPCGNEEFESAFISDEETLNNAIYKIFYSAPEIIKNKGLLEYKRIYRENKILYISDKMELL